MIVEIPVITIKKEDTPELFDRFRRVFSREGRAKQPAAFIIHKLRHLAMG